MKTITFNYDFVPFIKFKYDENIWTEEKCTEYLDFLGCESDGTHNQLYNLFKLWATDILKNYYNKNKSIKDIIEEVLDWEAIPNFDGSEGVTIDYLDLDIFDSDLIE